MMSPIQNQTLSMHNPCKKTSLFKEMIEFASDLYEMNIKDEEDCKMMHTLDSPKIKQEIYIEPIPFESPKGVSDSFHIQDRRQNLDLSVLSFMCETPIKAVNQFDTHANFMKPSPTTTLYELTNYKASGKKLCSSISCPRRAQSNGKCKKHGGGARCQKENCTKSSQGGGFCRAHGGGKKCKKEGCSKGTQRNGFCYIHGGVKYCLKDSCKQKDRGNGFCIKHGGGKRCVFSHCNRAVRKGQLCPHHTM